MRTPKIRRRMGMLGIHIVIILLVACVNSMNLVFNLDQNEFEEKRPNEAIYKPYRQQGNALWDWEPLKVKGAEFNQEKYFSNLDRSRNSDQKCEYQACDLGKPDMLNVHLVAHTHDDVGWLVTVDQYYYQAVQYILDSVVSELQKGSHRRFIYVEIAFFYRWWNQLHDSGRHVIKGLVNSGKLEFILGGWCMNDEAATHYNAIIDQHTLGFKFLKDNFGDCARPKIGWQIDPFGHSREQASLFAQFGFDGLFFGRLDFQDKDTRQKSKTMEMLWQGSPDNLGDQGALLTGVNHNLYQPPSGFCFDIYCDDFIQDDDRLEDYNKDDKVKDFLKAANDQAKSYSTNHIMMTMGSDFQFQNGHKNFKNLDKLIEYVNEAQSKGSKVNVFYSTPSCYLYALNQANQTYTTKSDDFFPYAHRNHSFWTGYFVSRAALKGYVRQTNNFLQAVKQLDSLTQLRDEFGSDLKIAVLKKAMGVVQHHDAVSGTEKQAVADDYAKRLATGIAECEEVINYAYGKLLPKSSGVIPTQYFCPLMNVSYCPTTENNNKFTVLVYNPLGRSTGHWVRIPVTGSSYTVTGSDGKAVQHQVIPVSQATANIPAHNGSKATGELVFKTELPPLGYTTYFVSPSQGVNSNNVVAPVLSDGEDVTIENQHVSLTFDGTSGLLKSMSNKDSSLTTAVTQSLLYYEGMKGNNSKGEFQASGAYIFRPSKQTAQPVAETAKITVQKNGLVQEVYQTFNDWASQVFRIYDGSKHAEVEFTIGPIKIDDNIGREVISRFSTDLDTKSIFYTDANGREVLKRVRDFRPTWKLNQTEPVSGNYYPINSRIYIRDETKKTQFTVMTDRSQGGGSIHDGEIEIMLHRRTMDDDSLGVGEPLNETGISGKGLVVRGKHLMIFDSIDASARHQRSHGEKMFMAPIVTFSPLQTDPSQYSKNYHTQWSGLKTALPENVHLLTLEQWDIKNLLLRLEHFYENGEDAELSKPASVSLKDLFTTFSIASVTELTLGGNQPLSQAKRLQWNINGHTTNGDMSSFVTPVDPSTLTVILKPMQIRTFEVTLGGTMET